MQTRMGFGFGSLCFVPEAAPFPSGVQSEAFGQEGSGVGFGPFVKKKIPSFLVYRLVIVLLTFVYRSPPTPAPQRVSQVAD